LHVNVTLFYVQGKTSEDLARRYKIENWKQERWRDETLWLLAGLAKLLDIRTFYYHLKEDRQADMSQVKAVKRTLGNMRHQVYDLQEQLKNCFALGPLLREMHRMGYNGIGVRTVRKLEEAGLGSLETLRGVGVEELVGVGVKQRVAERVAGLFSKSL
jgi:helicase